MAQIISTFSEISDRYDAAFVDLWGCVHNGLRPFPDAVAALQTFRAKGGRVILVTNAPRSREAVAKQLEKIGVPGDSWDAIATSGDSARAAMFRGIVGEKVFFMGQEHDHSFLTPLAIDADPVPVRRVPLEEAEGIVCCGPFDPVAEPDTLRPELLFAKQKGLKLLCANPDLVVDRGETREYCAGSIAKLYTEMGGESLYFGKPHPPIYDLARRRLHAISPNIPDANIIAIGDGIITDVAGAMGEDLDCLFITGGLAAAETKTETQPDPEALETYLTAEMSAPSFAIGFLR